MIQKKICLIGAYAVGKTSLAARFVKSIFSEKYHTSIGVKIDKKVVPTEAGEVTLMIWDLAGEDDFGQAMVSYLRGASGYLLVADGTRRATLQCAIALESRVRAEVGPIPFQFLINKADLQAEWEFTDADLADIDKRGWPVLRTSAKTGDRVEEAFAVLAAAVSKPT